MRLYEYIEIKCCVHQIASLYIMYNDAITVYIYIHVANERQPPVFLFQFPGLVRKGVRSM